MEEIRSAAHRAALKRVWRRLRSFPLARMGLFASQEGEHEIVPILASTKCDYKVPLTYPDEIIVTAKTVKVGRTSFTQAYEITSTAQKCVAAVGEGIIVCVDRKSGKPVPVPEDIRSKIERAAAPPTRSALGLRISRRGGIDDTDPKAREVQFEILRRMSPARKMELVEDANACAKELAMAGLRARHAGATPDELRRRLLGLLLGEELATRAYGPLS